MVNRIVSVGVALTALVCSAPAFAANIVANPGFETGALAPWTSLPGAWYPAAFQTGILPYTGTYFAASACSTACDLSQTLATVSGQTYDLSFAYNAGIQATISTGNVADLLVFWNGVQIDHISGGPLVPAWSVYTVSGLQATGGSTALTFRGYQPLAPMGLDAVSVAATAAAAVPEPATWAMTLVGFAFVGGVTRRRREGAVALA